MFLRARWMGVGVVVGAGGTVWLRHRWRQVVARTRPSQAVPEAAVRVREWALDVADAVREGRAQASTREAELRARYGQPERRPVDGGDGGAGERAPILHLVPPPEAARGRRPRRR
ncbi:MAG TPA: hypothetical protein VKV25_01145 [Acidimicrobiales bacterium]|nr:hypothetical protein [Acidimicrobiales bacterium]